MTMTEEFLRHYRDAHESTAQLEGGTWYRKSRKAARTIAADTGCTLSQAAGVLAAISPRMTWKANKRLAAIICAGGEVSGVFGANLAKARRIMNGEKPLSVLGGDKVRAFYRAIMGDEDAVVLDVWMLRAAQWQKKSLTHREYEEVANALREAARAANVNPADFQAIVWTQIRGGAE